MRFKQSNCGAVVHLLPNVSFLVLALYLGFKIHNILYYFVKLVSMDKTCKFHELWLNTDLIFGNNPKAYRKILLAFCRGNHFHANSRSAYKVTS